MDPSQHINIASSKRNRNSIGKSSRIDPCLLYRLCEVPTKLWRDRDELQILKLMHEYRYYQSSSQQRLDQRFYVLTAKRKLERLQFLTSSSFVKI
jgi:hypothetical protein